MVLGRAREAPRLRAIVGDLEDGESGVGRVGRRLLDAHQSRVGGIGQATQEYAADHTKGGGVRADAKGNGDDGEDGERRRLPERPQREA